MLITTSQTPAYIYPKHQTNMTKTKRLGGKILTSNITQSYKHNIETTNKHVHHQKCMFM